jgi:hypothetical protein
VKQTAKKERKTKKAVKHVLKEKLSTMSNDSNNNPIPTNDVSNLEKPFEGKKHSSESEPEDKQKNSHFNLRKRKKINYSVTRPDFLYESLSDSDYEEQKSKKYLAKLTKKQEKNQK